MRTHLQIIQAAGGYKAFAAAIKLPPSRVRFWERRQAIPPEEWRSVADAGKATLDELAEAAEFAAKERAASRAERAA